MVNEVATQTAAPISYAVIFPGQGSQSVGMLADWAAQYPIVKATFDEASAALGFDLWAVCQGNENAASLDDTAYTQPALLTASMAIWRVLQDELPTPPTLQDILWVSIARYAPLAS